MKLSVIAVGRLKAGPEKDLAGDYLKRLEGLGRKAGITKVTVKDFAESQQASPAARMEEEARLIASQIPAGAVTVVLDERGTSMPSEALSAFIRKHIDAGAGDMAFLIGGPDGHGAAIRGKAALLLSFGAMTWPHRLVRVMLFEQIYRAVTIMVNHPYHRP